MEKMDSEKKCQHIKCYRFDRREGVKRWICEMCGEEGEDGGKHAVVIGRYEQLKAKKERGEFKER